MRQKDIQRANQLEKALIEFSQNVRALPGILPTENRLAFVEQVLESIRRVQYVHLIRDKVHSPSRKDPRDDLFDPLKAAALHRVEGNLDEACWLVFLAIHFGKHRHTGWRLTRDVYGALGGNATWTWSRIVKDHNGIHQWLADNFVTLTSDGTPRHFGNHRKYETLRPSENGTGAVVASYVQWVLENGDHAGLFETALHTSEGDPRRAFHYLYESMSVHRFGRTAKFDYLTMLAKLGLAPIEADSAYLVGATGPLRGARLLFGGTISAKLSAHELEGWLVQLAESLGVGMQEMEDALCNWQKVPGRFVRFRG